MPLAPRFRFRVCPTCKRPEIDAQLAGSPHTNRAKLLHFIERHPEGVTREQCLDHIYAGDPDGGALPNTISVMVAFINRTIAPNGLRIKSTMGHGAVYYLDKLASPCSKGAAKG